MEFFGCNWINVAALNFNGRIDIGEKCLMLCCEPVENRPASAFKETAQKTVEGFMKMRNALILESKKYKVNQPHAKRRYTSGCAECVSYQLGNWNGDGRIHYINLSMYPAPCQCNCIYCHIPRSESGRFNKETCGEFYERLFDALEYAKRKRLIAETATWQVSSGEIAIHPYKDRILDLVKNQHAMFYTNCFIFDEGVAQNLSSNPNSFINLSIDSGTPETWFKIKGVDNFEKVTNNLVKYFNSSARKGQITLKYIILPGINDNLEDYQSVIEIMKILKVGHLTIARDVREKYNDNFEQLEELIGAAGYLLAMLSKNGLTADMYTFAPNERQIADEFANSLLQAGEV